MWSPMWEMGISTPHCEHLMVGRKLDALTVAAMLFRSHCLSTIIRPGPRNALLLGMRSDRERVVPVARMEGLCW